MNDNSIQCRKNLSLESIYKGNYIHFILHLQRKLYLYKRFHFC